MHKQNWANDDDIYGGSSTRRSGRLTRRSSNYRRQAYRAKAQLRRFLTS